jgi:hypothetical protein
MISCDESDETSESMDAATCQNYQDGDYEVKFTQVITRDDSGDECPMITPEGLSPDEEDDTEEEDGITTCVSEYEDDPEFVCRAVLNCTTTQPNGLTVDYAATFTVDDEENLTGVLELEVNGIYCSYAVAGELEAQ